MFSLHKKEPERKVLLEEPQPPQVPVSVPVKPENGAETLAEYSKLAAAIGYAPGYLLEERVKLFLSENGITVYPLDRVEKYLTSTFGAPGKGDAKWCWRPMRQVDKARNLTLSERNYSHNGHFDNRRIYNHPVPYPVLLTVKKITEAFPEVSFYISDAATEGDPFLLITAIGMSSLVVERWDEPAFRM